MCENKKKINCKCAVYVCNTEEPNPVKCVKTKKKINCKCAVYFCNTEEANPKEGVSECSSLEIGRYIYWMLVKS